MQHDQPLRKTLTLSPRLCRGILTCVDETRSLFLPLIFLLHRSHAGRCRPPFFGLFTLWLSIMAAVGLASRCSCSRHCS